MPAKFLDLRIKALTTVMIFTAFCFFAPAESSGQAVDPKEVGQKINAYAQKVLENLEIPGLAIAATRDGKVIYTGAFGVRSLVTREALRPEDIFHFASVSKPFVATAIMQLVELGRMRLDEKLVTYLPYFRLADERYKIITIRQMLNHTSGMPDVIDYEWDKPQYDEGAAERYVRSLSGEKMVSAPGEEFHYSNMAFDVLGDVIAKVSGEPFEIYEKKHILNPLGMKETSFLREEIRKDLRTAPHTGAVKPAVSEVYPYNRPHAPSSTLNSSVVEMANWAIANINQGEFRGKRILKEESYSPLWTPTVKVDQQRQIGLSWGLWSHKGERAIGHGGGDLGYRSYLLLLPDKRIGLVLASNYDRTPIDEIASGVMDILLGYKPELPKKSIPK